MAEGGGEQNSLVDSITSTIFDAYNNVDKPLVAKIGTFLAGLIPVAAYQSNFDKQAGLKALADAKKKGLSLKAAQEAATAATKYGAMITNKNAKLFGWKPGLWNAITKPSQQINVPKSMPPITEAIKKAAFMAKKGFSVVKGLVKSPFTPLGVTAALLPTEGSATASNVGNLMSGPEPMGFPGLNTTSPNYTSNVLSQPSTSPVGVTPVSVSAPVSAPTESEPHSPEHDTTSSYFFTEEAKEKRAASSKRAASAKKAASKDGGRSKSKGRTTAAPASGPHGGGMTSSESAKAGRWGTSGRGEFDGGYGDPGMGVGMGGFGGWT
jgi:hypothetical protein